MLWTIFIIILLLWLLGFSLHIAGGLIHLLLVVALVVLIFNLVTGRRGIAVREQSSAVPSGKCITEQTVGSAQSAYVDAGRETCSRR